MVIRKAYFRGFQPVVEKVPQGRLTFKPVQINFENVSVQQPLLMNHCPFLAIPRDCLNCQVATDASPSFKQPAFPPGTTFSLSNYLFLQ
jgi:hypothetical protein